jgi:TolA-binding protein
MRRINFNKTNIVITIAMLAAAFSSAYSKSSTKEKRDSISEYQQHISNVKFDSSDRDLATADKIRVQGIKSTYDLIKDKTINQSEKFELYLRLGQLHLERHDFLKHVEIKSFHSKYDKFIAKQNAYKRKGYKTKLKNLKEPKLLQTGSKNELKKSIKALSHAIKRYPKERRLDIALFTLGQTKLLIKENDGHKYLLKLVRKFKKSALYPDANLALGEYYFDNGDPKKASYHYSKLLKHKNHKGYLYSVYKMGWCNYNLSFDSPKQAKYLNKSLAAFKIVVKQSKKKRWSSSFNLREEALNDVILVFSEIGNIELAREFFIPKKEDERFYKTVMRIGSKLTDSGKHEKAIKAYNIIIKESPFHENIPAALTNIIKINEAMKKLGKVHLSIKQMISFLGKDGLWQKNKSKIENEIFNKSQTTLENTIRHYGTKYHKIGQKSANKNFLLAAAKIYQLYLGQYSENARTTELRHYLADILLGFKAYKQAGRHFILVLRSPNGKKYRVEALDNALFAFEKAVAKENLPLPGPTGQVKSPGKIPETKLMYLSALETLVRDFPKDKRHVDAKFRIASILYEHGHYKNSLGKFSSISIKHPRHKLAVNSAKIYMNHHYNNKDWLTTITSSTNLLKNKSLMRNKGLKSYILSLNRQSYFNHAVDLEKNNDFMNSGKYFVKYQKLFPSNKNADVALYNASVNFHKGGNTNLSVNTGKLLIQNYPKSKLTKETTAWVADTLESTARFEDAIKYYKAFHKSYPNDRRSRNYLYNAATLAIGLELKEESLDLFNLYSKFYPKDDFVEQIKFNTAEIHYENGEPTKARKMYEWLSFNASSEEKRLEAKAQGMLILIKQDKKSGLTRLESFAKQLINNKKVPAIQARKIVSEELLNNLETELLAYNRMGIKDGNNLMKDIGAKNSKLSFISQKLETIAAVGLSEYSAAALYILGDLHERIASDILNAPMPNGITNEETQDIKKQLVDASTPLFADSKNFYQRSFNIAQEMTTFSDWSIKITRKMKDQFPEVIAISEIETLTPDHLAHKVAFDATTEKLIR